MRNSKFTRLLSVILAAVLLFGSFSAVLSFAEDAAAPAETEVSVEIISKNLNYASRTEIAYAVEATGVKETDSVVMLFWNEAQADEDYTYEKALYRKNFYDKGTVQEVEGCYLFTSRGIVPKDINDSIYARPVIRHADVVNGEVVVSYTYGAVLKYNVGMYAAEKLAETDNSAAQIKLYAGLISYAEAASAKFGASEPDFMLAKVTDGAATLGNFGAKYAIADKDGKITLRAEAINAEGKYFIKWVDAEGADVATARVAKITAPTEAGVHLYTPVYGEAADSAYADTIGFQDYVTGEVNVGEANYAADPGTACYGGYSSSNMKRWSIDKTIGQVRFYQNILPAYTAYDSSTKTYTFAKNALGYYVPGMMDKYFITEDTAGDKNLVVNRGQNGSGWTVSISPYATDRKVLNYVEMDLGFEDITMDGVQVHVNVSLKDANGKEFPFRTNLFTYWEEGKTHIYPEGFNSAGVKGDDGLDKFFSSAAGETFTFGIGFVSDTVDGETKYFLEYYVNGEYFGRLAADSFKSGSNTCTTSGFVLSDDVYLYSASVNTVTSNKDNVVIDNVTFTK